MRWTCIASCWLGVLGCCSTSPAHENAHTLLRQSVRYCVDAEKQVVQHKRTPGIRTVLPKLLDQYRLAGRTPGTR